MHVNATELAVNRRPMSSRKARLDGRCRIAQAVKRLAGAYAGQLGGWGALKAAQAEAVRRVAELAIAAKEARAALLRGDSRDLLGVTRIEGAFRRALYDIGLNLVAAKPLAESAAEYLARKQREGAAT